MYRPALGRFVQADTLIPDPAEPLSWERYAYVLNNPLRYSDPTGHFTEEAIQDYLERIYGKRLAEVILEEWKTDEQWWAMLRKAQAGDVLYGQGWLYPSSGGLPMGAFPVAFQFSGKGDTSLEGIIPGGETASIPGFRDATLMQIHNGTWSVGSDQAAMDWRGIVRLGENPSATARLIYSRYHDAMIAYTSVSAREHQVAYETSFFVAYTIAFGLPLLFGLPDWATYLVGLGLDRAGFTTRTAAALVDSLDLEVGDVHVIVGPVEFNTQPGREGFYGLELH